MASIEPMESHYKDYIGMDSSILAGVNLLIAVGSIIMILGFLGCCGAVKESRCMLMLVEEAFDSTLSIMVDSLQSTTGEHKEYQEEFQKFERKPCGDVIMQQIKDNLVIIMGIAFGLAAVEKCLRTT
ncbi:hypothetical protein IHE44_0012047 [Lamprotornis superbus]|uniref:Uncharacterized protein n=1 Tax=Lamprotornis superbus TaxID=245042 RepID=A0A835NY47_9PASS|nr:hypothetical protein IHE44_0012047 [Lamprotornis superbus]